MSREPYRSCTECTFGYCAALRCYCGHAECAAFATYVKPQPLAVAIAVPATNPHASSWANREEATWLDKL